MQLILKTTFILLIFTVPVSAQNYGTVKKQNSFVKSDFSVSGMAEMGDLNEDNNPDLVIGNPVDFEQEVYITFLNDLGNVKSETLITSDSNGFNHKLNSSDNFGQSITNLGDVNKDGINDIAIGAPGANGRRGEVFILFLKRDGTVKDFKKISETFKDFSVDIKQDENFGWSLGTLKDWNGNGVNELLVGSPFRKNNGAIWILQLNNQGEIISKKEISNKSNPLQSYNLDDFGESVTGIGDLNNDGFNDVLIGDKNIDDPGFDNGAIFSLFLEKDNGIQVQSTQKISTTSGNLNDSIRNNGLFGNALASMGDLNGDSVQDIAVGSFGEDYPNNSNAGFRTGKVRILFMNENGTVKNFQSIGLDLGNFQDSLKSNDAFGGSLANIGDLNNDSVPELGVGAPGKETIYILFLNGVPQTPEDTSSGLEPNKPFQRLNTYPNPVTQSQNLTLSLPSALPEGRQSKVLLFDMEGQLVYEEGFTYQGEQEIQLALGELPSGNYQLFLRAGDFQGFSKVVVE